MAKFFAQLSGSKVARISALALVVAGAVTYISLSDAASTPTGVGQTQNITHVSQGVPTFEPGTLCVLPQNGDRFHVHTVTATNTFEHTYVFDGGVFHSDEAGCEPTVENFSITGGSVTGKTVYAPGETGTLVAKFDTQAFDCGRVQYDMGFYKQGRPDISDGDYSGLFYGIVINYGRDCGPVVQPCQNVTGALTKQNETVGASHVTGDVVVSLGGDNVTGTLTLDGVNTTVTNGQAVPFSFARPAFGQPALTKTYTLSVHQGNDLCATKTVTVHVPALPQTNQPCTGVSVTLGKSGEATSATHVTGNVVIGVVGSNATGRLTIDGATSTVTNGQSIPFSFARPDEGQPSVTKTYTLQGLVGTEVCHTTTVTVTVPPKTKVHNPCDGVNATLTKQNEDTSSSQVTGNLVIDLAGSNVTAQLTLDGTTTTVTDGQTVSYSYNRPGNNQSALTKTGTLRAFVNGDLCDTAEVTITVPPTTGGGGGGGRARIERSKSAWNETLGRDANKYTAQAGNVIVYTLTAENTGTRSERNFEFEDDISDVLELADLVSYNGAEFDAKTKTLTWDDITVPAKKKVIKTFTVRIKSNLPVNQTCVIENTFGNKHIVNVNCPKVSGTTTPPKFEAPKSGSENFLVAAFALLTVAGVAGYRMRKESVNA